MIAAFAFATAVLAPAETPIACAVMGSPINAKSPAVALNGIKFGFCCGGCDTKFKAEPAKYLEAAAKGGKTIGEFLFDPVSKDRLMTEDAQGSMDFKGIRYRFASKSNLETFKKTPEKFASVPAKEVLYCVVMKEEVKSYADADSYADHDGVRYYMCCGGCKTKFAKNPGSFVANGTPKAAALATKKEDN